MKNKKKKETKRNETKMWKVPACACESPVSPYHRIASHSSPLPFRPMTCHPNASSEASNNKQQKENGCAMLLVPRASVAPIPSMFMCSATQPMCMCMYVFSIHICILAWRDGCLYVSTGSTSRRMAKHGYLLFRIAPSHPPVPFPSCPNTDPAGTTHSWALYDFYDFRFSRTIHWQ